MIVKKYLVLFIAVVCFVSCSVDDNNDRGGYSFEILPVESVDMPTEFELGEIYPITISYFRPSTCHEFDDFYYLKELNERTIAPINYLYEGNNCVALDSVLVDQTFNFEVTSNGSYIFKFWQGEDTNGESEFLTIEVPVIE